MQYFTSDNTDGFRDSQLAALNHELQRRLVHSGYHDLEDAGVVDATRRHLARGVMRAAELIAAGQE